MILTAPIQPVHERAATRVVTSAGFRFTEARYPPRYQIARHRHGAAGLTFVMAGAMRESLGGAVREVPAHTALYKPADEAHYNRFGNTGAHCLVAEPDTERAGQLEAASPLLCRVGQLRAAAVAPLVRRLERELRYSDSALPLLLESITLEAIALGMRGETSRSAPQWLRVALDYLDTHFLVSVRLDDVARAAGVHSVHLARVFRTHVGTGPAEYVRRRRIDWAAGALRRSPDPIAAIALQAGFSDQSHFTKAFRKYVGVTPAVYRRASTR